MKFIKLNGKNIHNDAKIIRDDFENGRRKMVYVLTHPTTKLYSYIDALHDEEGIGDNILFDFKICYEKESLDLSFVKDDFNEEEKIDSVSELIKRLEYKPCSVIVNDNSRITLAEISQQLIYIGYPLTLLDIKLRKEAKDAQKTLRFMKKVGDISAYINTTITKIEDLYHFYRDKKWYEIDTISDDEKNTLLNIINEAKTKCEHIKEKVEKAKNIEMKIAVMATKKTGKSVIVNDMIGEELIPTSLTLPTPNTCIYKKSQDSEYHLIYNEEKKNYSTASEIHKVIKEEFNKAQESKLSIPDMTIEYVTKGNNFDTFTVYDTPGPDLAGTDHHISAYKSMEECDVAVFAIDYTKHLTDDEEKYLRNIKEHFNKNQKFASLLFAINKIDQRFNDADSTKSIVYIIDLIRAKLIGIDKRYKDCIIFAISALQYYNTIHCEKVCGDEFSKSENLDIEINSIRNHHKNDTIIRSELIWLNNIMNYYLGEINLEKITAKDLKQYSGMEDLLNYAAYICKAKERDEIVNNITVTIDAHTKELKAINDRIDNIDKLIKIDEMKIQDIKNIINEYKSTIEDSLSETILEKMLKPSEEYKNISFFLEDRQSGTFENFKKRLEDLILTRYTSDFEVYNSIVDKIQAVSFDHLKSIIQDNIDKKICISQNDINKINNQLFSENTINQYVTDYICNQIELGKEEALPCIEGLGEEIVSLVNTRIDTIKKASEKCKKELEKMDISLQVPMTPDFKFELQDYKQTEDWNYNISLKIDEDEIKKLFIDKQMNSFWQFCHNLFNWDFGNKHYKVKLIDYEEYKKNFKSLRSDIQDALNNANIYKILKRENENLTEKLKEAMEKIQKDFREILCSLKYSVDKFSSLIDDTEKHRINIEAHNREKELIKELNECFKEFIDEWEVVLGNVENTEM